MKKLYFLFLIISFVKTELSSQCPNENAVVYLSNDKYISYDSLARICAPVLWFSQDEPDLLNEEGLINLPELLPYDQSENKPTVYYKIKEVFTDLDKASYNNLSKTILSKRLVDLSNIIRLEIEYYCYYAEEKGAGSHPHDLEAILFQLAVHKNSKCTSEDYALEVKRVVAKAHGLYWFHNILSVDKYSLFPMTILVEEGKHANCTDKNADGLYTPGYDVNEKPNDAWGLRDIISTGRLFTGGFQSWMQKERNFETAIFPPGCQNKASVNRIINSNVNGKDLQFYQLKSFPALPENYPDKKLSRMVKSKKPKHWPRIHGNVKFNKNTKVEKENVLRNKVGISWRFPGFEYSVPLLFVRHVEAPMTGGWFYHKLYTSSEKQFGINDTRVTDFGHQIRHSTSASRWLDTYVGMGYELISDLEDSNYNDLIFVSEIGIKIRLNITVTPLKFLKILGTDYWGLSLGWKNRGFSAFESGGFVIAIGAGAF